MAKVLSNVVLMPAVEGISRKLALRRETCTNKEIAKGGDQLKKIIIPGKTYMGISSYTRNVFGVGQVRKNLLFMRKAVSAQVPTAAQIAGRSRLIAAHEWALLAGRDLQASAWNVAQFRACLDDANKTVYGISVHGPII